jgi:hypothetical protein
MKLPPHISFSQYNTYVGCPRNWYLSKIQQAEQVQTWYIPIGTAVHQMIEEHLDDLIVVPRTAEEAFFPLISAQMKVEPDLSKWLAGGSKKNGFVTGDVALQRVKDCFERALEFLEDIDVWEVEYDASGPLPELSVDVSAFVDIIGEHKRHGPIILDWKSGSKKPDNAFQLETYSALLQGAKHQMFPGKGLWAMLAPGAPVARPIDLSAVDPREIGLKYQKVRTAMEAMQIQAKKKYMCSMCFNSVNCLEYSGPLSKRARYYDRSRHDQPPY